MKDMNRKDFIKVVGGLTGAVVLAACGGGSGGGSDDHEEGPRFSFNGYTPNGITTTNPVLVITEGIVDDGVAERVAEITKAIIQKSGEPHPLSLIYNGPNAGDNFYDQLDWKEVGHAPYVKKVLAAHPHISLDDGLAGTNTTPILCSYDQQNLGATVLRYLTSPATGVDPGNNLDKVGFELHADSISPSASCIGADCEDVLKALYSRMGHHVHTGFQEKTADWVDNKDGSYVGAGLITGLGEAIIIADPLTEAVATKNINLDGMIRKEIDAKHTLYLSQ